MELDPVVEHQTSHEWMEGETQSLDKVGDEHYLFAGVGRQHDLALLWGPMSDVKGEEACLLQVLDVVVGDARGLPLALRSRSGHCQT